MPTSVISISVSVYLPLFVSEYITNYINITWDQEMARMTDRKRKGLWK